MQKFLLRRDPFRPFRKGLGPTFTLALYETFEKLNGKDRLAYRLTMKEPGKKSVRLFVGNDFGASPCHAIDSDATVAALMNFLTLRPGDTDAEYFSEYTPEQIEYCNNWAEPLAVEVQTRFGEC